MFCCVWVLTDFTHFTRHISLALGVNMWLPSASQATLDMYKLEQLERLRSEIPPTGQWLPILVTDIRSQIKTDSQI